MNLYVRADADARMGTGHIMRCIAPAQAWQDQGGEITFISHCESDALKETIQSEGFRFIAFDHVCPDASDLKSTLSILKNESVDHKNWLVLDGYHFTPEYQKAIRDEGIHLLVIDDMNHLPHYHADILLNQNIHAPDLKYHCDEDTTLLLGTRYVLLRREFLKYREFKRQVPDRAKNILVTLGGADPDNVTLKVIEALKLLDVPDISARIIIGPANPHQETLRMAIASAHFEAELLINPLNMPELMAWADMAISAAGSTCWELAFMGVPIMALILADNQKAVAEGISKEGFAVNLGWYKTFDEKITSGKINTLIQSKDRRLNMVQKGQALTSASGRDHLCERILTRSISIKLAKESDCELIWHWANDQEVRNSAFCSDMILFEDHKKWFYSKIHDPQSYQFVGYDGRNRAIGQIRFDELSDREYDVDVSIDKRFREKGCGSELIKQAIRELLNVAAVDVIHSHVKFGNSASKYVFLSAGFIREKDTIIKNTACLHFVWKRK
jgi:UDP-2,4-diacetamido-2,4,6-trideoxy-beta-L-altropyranose hydrolase